MKKCDRHRGPGRPRKDCPACNPPPLDLELHLRQEARAVLAIHNRTDEAVDVAVDWYGEVSICQPEAGTAEWWERRNRERKWLGSPYTVEEWEAICSALKAERGRRPKLDRAEANSPVDFPQAEQARVMHAVIRSMRFPE